MALENSTQSCHMGRGNKFVIIIKMPNFTPWTLLCGCRTLSGIQSQRVSCLYFSFRITNIKFSKNTMFISTRTANPVLNFFHFLPSLDLGRRYVMRINPPLVQSLDAGWWAPWKTHQLGHVCRKAGGGESKMQVHGWGKAKSSLCPGWGKGNKTGVTVTCRKNNRGGDSVNNSVWCFLSFWWLIF